MISLVIAYAMTLFGMIFAGTWDFPEMAGLMTGIGVLITIVHDVRADYKLKGFVITLAIHALMWIIGTASPETFGYILGLVIFIPVCILLLAFLIPWISDFLHLGGDTERAPKGDTAVLDMPYLITDDVGRTWEYDGPVGYGVRYRLQAGQPTEVDFNDSLHGDTVLIEQKNIDGNTARVFSRSFHW